jgi:hypothetical protein
MHGRFGSVLLSVSLALAAFPMEAGAQSLAVNALADIRLVRPSDERSWMVGGLGRFLYDGGGDHDPGLRLGQLLVDVELKPRPDTLLFATIRHEPTQRSAIDIVEAFAQHHLIDTGRTRWTIKLGAFHPPISIENDGIGWTSPWTLTPSAINTWVGEELRTIGAETGVEWKTPGGAVGLLGAMYGGNDPTGVLIAARGWSLGDKPTGLFDRVRIADDVARRARRVPPYYESEFLEIDDRTGFYGGLSWRENGIGRLTLLRYGNRGDPTARRFGQVGWRTEFTSLGLEAYFLKNYALFGQAMAGETEIDPAPGARRVTRFQSAYVLAGRHVGDWHVAFRVDVFGTQSPVGNDMSERGHALTAAATWSPERWLQLTGEILRTDSRRSQRAGLGLPPRAAEIQILLNARFLY